MQLESNLQNKSIGVMNLRKILIIALCMIAIVQSGTRDISKLPIENDTPVYQETYERIANTPWSVIFANFSLISTEYDGRDAGYPIFLKLTQLITVNFTFYMFFIATLFMLTFGMLIYKYVRSPLGIILSFLVFFALFSNIINSFMRQAITLSIVLFALRFVLSREWKKYFILILLAITIHSSAIVAAPLYFLYRIVSSKKWVLMAIIITPVLMLFSKLLLISFVSGTLYEDYIGSDSANPSKYIGFIFLFLILGYLSFNYVKNQNGYELLISGIIGSLLLTPIVQMGYTLLRISYYYVLLLVPLIPIIIDSSKVKPIVRLTIYFLSISFLFIFISY